MCWEDVQIARSIKSYLRRFTFEGVDSLQVAGPSDTRMFIEFHSIVNIPAYVSPVRMTGFAQGVVFDRSVNPSVRFSVYDHGDIVRGAWYLIVTDPGPLDVIVIEGHLTTNKSELRDK